MLSIGYLKKSEKNPARDGGPEKGLRLFVLYAVVLVDAGHGELDPLGEVHRVVADALKILGDHE